MADRLYKKFGCMSIGMEDAFFKLGIPSFGKYAIESTHASYAEFEDIANNYFTTKYDFNNATGKTPDIVFIFLGTNDLTATSSEAECATFVSTYKAFVAKIFETYGADTEICIMQSLTTVAGLPSADTGYGLETNARVRAINTVATELITMYPDNVTFIDHERILSWGVEIGTDNVHPTTNGYATLVTQVAEFLKDTYK